MTNIVSTVLAVISDNVLIAVFGGIITLGVAALGPLVTVVMFILKERSDAKRDEAKEKSDAAARAEARKEAEAARAIINGKIDENTVMNSNALNAANGLTGKIANSIKLVETAASLITQPKKSDSALGDSAENPIHTITP